MRAPSRRIALAGALACALPLGACGASRTPAVTLVEPTAAVREARSNPVTVSPLPGTLDATAQTQISFLGGARTRVTDVRVVGSISGAHPGALRAYSTGTGESFLPSRGFVPGEHVTVSARVVGGAGRGARVRSSFSIAPAVGVAQTPFPLDAGDPAAVQHYVSAPGLTPSRVRITTPARAGASPGYLFLAPYQGRGAAGPMITDQSGNLVWFDPLPKEVEATNFGVQDYDGAPALTWWQGRIIQVGFGEGEDVIYDDHYREIASVRAGNGLPTDLHSFRLTPQGTAWVDAYEPVRMDLSSLGGASHGVINDSVVQEIDVRTGLVMWEWHALGHISTAESKNPVPASAYPWDYVHINAIDPGAHGDVLLSLRNTWSLDDVDIHSGGFRWRIGGVRSTFKLGPGATFYWQHDAALQPGGLISVFDNGSDPPEEKQSRGLLLEPDARTHTVRLVRVFANPSTALLAPSQGSMRPLSGGNWLLGYGGLPNFTEFDPSGHVLLDGTLGQGVQSFTATLSPWSGSPPGAPALAPLPGRGGGGVSVAVSWNGATAVASWRLLAGASPSTLTAVASAPKAGFETVLSSPAAGPDVAVQALDAAGAVVGVSATIAD
ncbi:MAG TPA: arylsulfotransferase family protein [Solirubrobacteraceae bacterium]|nr:arylsulfotransferase family protein [Solirubrobacteraceae bacterium]